MSIFCVQNFQGLTSFKLISNKACQIENLEMQYRQTTYPL